MCCFESAAPLSAVSRTTTLCRRLLQPSLHLPLTSAPAPLCCVVETRCSTRERVNTGGKAKAVQPTTQGNLDLATLSQQAPQRVTLESGPTLAPIQVDVNPFDEKFYEIPPSSTFDTSEEDLPLKPVSGRRVSRSKMHQTSSRLLRMTEDDRPFTRVSSHAFVHCSKACPLLPHIARMRLSNTRSLLHDIASSSVHFIFSYPQLFTIQVAKNDPNGFKVVGERDHLAYWPCLLEKAVLRFRPASFFVLSKLKSIRSSY